MFIFYNICCFLLFVFLQSANPNSALLCLYLPFVSHTICNNVDICMIIYGNIYNYHVIKALRLEAAVKWVNHKIFVGAITEATLTITFL